MKNKIDIATSAYKKKDFKLAEKISKEIILREPNNLTALNILGLINVLELKYEEAATFFEKIVIIKPNDYANYFNLGKALQKTLVETNQEKAIKYYDLAIKLKPTFLDALINKAIILEDLGKYESSLNCCNEILKINPNSSKALLGKALNLYKLGKHVEALKYCDKAIEINPNNKKNWVLKGLILSSLNVKEDEELQCYNKAISIDNSDLDARYNRGLFFSRQKKFTLALQDLQYVYFVNPKYKFLLAEFLLIFSNLLDFQKKNSIINQIFIDIKDKNVLFNPLLPLFNYDDLELQIKLIQNYTNNIHLNKNFNKKLNFSKKLKTQIIKIAYFSSDFGEHPVGRQIVELFELHDRNNFEIYLFSLTQRPNCLLKQRIIKASDHFIEVHDKTFLEIIDLVRSLNIDIAVDLNGYTLGKKPEIFSAKVAPIQVNYLGYPGTMGADFMDYIVADKIVIPKEYMEKYSEKIVYLPNSYQVNDRLKKISEQKFTRSDFGLKDEQFVFCCFGMVYKITEEIFKTWMNILNKVPNSILWLLEPNEIAKNNIIKEFEKNGISSTRVSFLKFSEHSVYLATHRLADLYLDTFPYNSHSTASESLWAGLPLITLTGKSFHTRVAASILNAINLPELVTNSLEEYEKLAIELALNPQKLKNIKNKLNSNIKTALLFDTPLYTKNLESAYKQMYERYQSDQKPDHIYINE